MRTLSLADVHAVRERLARAHALAADRFRAAFDAIDAPTEERWRAHLEIQAAALLETADGVRVRGGGEVRYAIENRVVTPYVERGRPLFPFLSVARTPVAVFEYWMVISEILASSAWAVTRVIAEAGEYDDALRRMREPQLVRALVASFLPAVELRDDGTALLDVTLYTRAGEERVERRTLALDEKNEFAFHSRELIAEGRGGVPMG